MPSMEALVVIVALTVALMPPARRLAEWVASVSAEMARRSKPLMNGTGCRFQKGNAGWVNEVTNSAEGKEFLNRNGMDPFVGTPESANALVRSDSVKWKDYIAKAGIEKQ